MPLYIKELVKSNVLTSKQLADGTSRFIKMLPDQASDVPKIANYFAHTLFALLNNKAFEVK